MELLLALCAAIFRGVYCKTVRTWHSPSLVQQLGTKQQELGCSCYMTSIGLAIRARIPYMGLPQDRVRSVQCPVLFHKLERQVPTVWWETSVGVVGLQAGEGAFCCYCLWGRATSCAVLKPQNTLEQSLVACVTWGLLVTVLALLMCMRPVHTCSL